MEVSASASVFYSVGPARERCTTVHATIRPPPQKKYKEVEEEVEFEAKELWKKRYTSIVGMKKQEVRKKQYTGIVGIENIWEYHKSINP